MEVAKTDVNGGSGPYHETPLMVAAYYGSPRHLAVAKYLIAHGADVNAISLPDGTNTTLLTAIWKNHIDFAAYLLTQGAAASAVDADKACTAAISRKRLDFITLLPGCCARVKKSQLPTEALYLCP